MKRETCEILINATLVTAHASADIYEFVLNQDLEIVECVHVESLASNKASPVQNYRERFKETLFELNHVRINPRINNERIVATLTQALNDIGVEVKHQPHVNDLAQYYKPLGEITENVRFHFNVSGHCTFLCPKATLKLVNPNPPTENTISYISKRTPRP